MTIFLVNMGEEEEIIEVVPIPVEIPSETPIETTPERELEPA